MFDTFLTFFSDIQNEGYKDPLGVAFLEKYGDVGMWLIPTGSGLFSIYKGYLLAGPALFCVGIIQVVVVNVLKKTFPKSRPRPFFFEKSSVEDNGSFPSSHTAGAFLGVGLCLGLYGLKAASITTCALAVLVGLSRLLSKKHWPLDIISGGIIGMLSGLFCAAATKSFYLP